VDIETGESKSLRDEPGGGLLTGQVVSGVKAARARSAALAWNVGRPVSMLMAAVVAGIERERAVRRKPEALSTDATRAGGPARRSAGINRHGGGDGRALRRRSSDPRRP
jgi:hypothetical protein